VPVPWKELEPYLRIGPTQSRSHIWTSETLLDYLEFLTEELRTRRKELHLDRSHACLVICDCATQHSMRKYAALKAAWQEHQNCVPYIDISKYDCSFFACSSMSVQKTNRKLECLVMFLFSMKNKQDNMFINRYIPPFSGCVTCLPGDSHRRQRSRAPNPGSTQRRVPCFRTYAGEELRKLQSTIYGQGRQQTRAVTGIQIPSRFLSDEAPQMQRGRNKNEGIPSSISISI